MGARRPTRGKIIVFALFSIVIFLLIYFFKSSRADSLKEKERSVEVAWNAFNSDLSFRDSLLNSFSMIKFDSLKYFQQRSILERAKNEGNLNLEFYEYKINNYILAHFPNQKNLSELDYKLNKDLSNYNARAKEYNVYISMFLNFIIAKRLQYHKAKYFTIKYGETNEDPIIKSKELPEWARGVDTN